MKSKIKIKYIENSEYSYKNWNSKNSKVVVKHTAPIVLSESEITEDGQYIRIKNNKYSLVYNKTTCKAEVSQFLSALQSRSPVQKTRFIKEVKLDEYQVLELMEKFQMVETL